MSNESFAAATKTADTIARECFGWRIRRLNRMLSRAYDAELRAKGISLAQLDLLVHVCLSGAISRTLLGKEMQMERSTLSRTLRRMIDREWLAVVPSDTGAGVAIDITKDGEAALIATRSAWAKAQRRVEKEFVPEATMTLEMLVYALNRRKPG